jgi:hypothetical protein
MNPHAKKYEFRTIVGISSCSSGQRLYQTVLILPQAVEPQLPPAATGPRLATVPEEPAQHVTPTPAGALSQSSQAPWASLCRIEGLTRDKTVALFVSVSRNVVHQSLVPGILQMPILSYESYNDWEAVVQIIKQWSKEQQFDARKPAIAIGRDRNHRRWSDSSQAERDRSRLKEVATLINGYISPSGDIQPLHCRRTLDQYSYYMLDTTERRDKDQVVYRWVEKQKKSSKSADPQKPTPLIMVDQPWLWVLPDGMGLPVGHLGLKNHI